MTAAAESRRIRSLRSAKRPLDPWQPLDVLLEDERGADGRRRATVTVFLTGSECPFTCVFCDLWRHTLDEPTPVGAIPQQLDAALSGLGPAAEPTAIKLYNASNFFDPRAVPTDDLAAIAEGLRGFARVTVECHPRLVSEPCQRFARMLDGELEVALGLETIHPQALPRLNKQMSLEEFDRAVARLLGAGIGTRAFVLVGPPFVPADEAVEWAVRSADYALRRGVGVVSLIPTRTSVGEMERLRAAGLFTPPTLEVFETAVERSLQLARGVVLADLWDAHRLAGCADCCTSRIERLQQMALSGSIEPRVVCSRCSPGAGR